MESEKANTTRPPCGISKTHVADVARGEGFYEECDMGKSKALPAMPFYTGDWMKNPEIRAMPKAYRADCMDIWCYMWNSGDRGYLVDNAGNPYTKEELCIMLGYEENSENFSKFYDYISTKKVFEIRKKDNAWYSGFMVKLVEISEKRAKAGKKGGVSKSVSKTLAKPIANCEIEYEDENELFINSFWNIYPPGRKDKKPSCFEKYRAIIRDVSPDIIKSALEKYSQWLKDNEVQPKGPLVWLNNGCWDDELSPLPKNKGNNNAGSNKNVGKTDEELESKYKGM